MEEQEKEEEEPEKRQWMNDHKRWIRFTVTSNKAYKLAKEANHNRRRRRFGTCLWIPIYVFIFIYKRILNIVMMCGCLSSLFSSFRFGSILWYWCDHFQFDITICLPLNMVYTVCICIVPPILIAHQSKNDFWKHSNAKTDTGK